MNESYKMKKIKIYIKKEIKEFKKQLNICCKENNNITIIKHITNYISDKKGKLIRPILVLLIAKMLGNISKKTYYTACLVELIHIATLVHDDVIDNSKFRRGVKSVNAIWNNKISVLIGDYLLSKSLFLAINNDYFDLLKVLCSTLKNIIEGELLQIEQSKYFIISERIYDKIILKKTASLISASCECSAISVNADKKNIIKMKTFGILSGIAFQIKDDLFEYEKYIFTGKSQGIDFKERRITLPLIYAIKNASITDRKWLINSIKNYDKENKDKIINYVNKYKGLEYAKNKMIKYYNRALKILDIYPESPIKKSLKLMTNFIIERNQ